MAGTQGRALNRWRRILVISVIELGLQTQRPRSRRNTPARVNCRVIFCRTTGAPG